MPQRVTLLPGAAEFGGGGSGRKIDQQRSLLLSTPGPAPDALRHDLTGTVVNGLQMLEVLGKGAYGVVLHAREITGSRDYAVKIMERKSLKAKREWQKVNGQMRITTALDKVKRELAIMAKVSHPHVVKCHFTIDDENSDRIFLVLELLRGGTAMTYVDLPPPPPPPPPPPKARTRGGRPQQQHPAGAGGAGSSSDLHTVPEGSLSGDGGSDGGSTTAASDLASTHARPHPPPPPVEGDIPEDDEVNDDEGDDDDEPPPPALAGQYMCLGPPLPLHGGSKPASSRASVASGGGDGATPTPTPRRASLTASGSVLMRTSSGTSPQPPQQQSSKNPAGLPAGLGALSPGAGPGLTMTMGQARRVTRDVLKGLGYLFANRIVHRDLKPENILLTGRLAPSAGALLALPAGTSAAGHEEAHAAVAAAASGLLSSTGSSCSVRSTDSAQPPAASAGGIGGDAPLGWPVPPDGVDAELEATDPSVAYIGHALLADLGVAHIYEPDAPDDLLRKSEGTPAFHAPEATLGGGTAFSGQASDVWAVGVCAFAFVTGTLPFPVYHGTTQSELYDAIRTQPLPVAPLLGSVAVQQWLRPPPGGAVSLPRLRSRLALVAALVDFLGSVLAKDPRERATASAALEHPWLTYVEGPSAADDAAAQARGHLGTSADAAVTDDEVGAVLAQVMQAGVPVALPPLGGGVPIPPWLRKALEASAMPARPTVATAGAAAAAPLPMMAPQPSPQPSPPLLAPARSAVPSLAISPPTAAALTASAEAATAATTAAAIGTALLSTANSGGGANRIAVQLLRSQRPLFSSSPLPVGGATGTPRPVADMPAARPAPSPPTQQLGRAPTPAVPVRASSSTSLLSTAGGFAPPTVLGAPEGDAAATAAVAAGGGEGVGSDDASASAPHEPYALAFAPGAAMEVTDEEVAALVQNLMPIADVVMLKIVMMRLMIRLRRRLNARRAIAAAAAAAAREAEAAEAAAASASPPAAAPGDAPPPPPPRPAPVAVDVPTAAGAAANVAALPAPEEATAPAAVPVAVTPPQPVPAAGAPLPPAAAAAPAAPLPPAPPSLPAPAPPAAAPARFTAAETPAEKAPPQAPPPPPAVPTPAPSPAVPQPPTPAAALAAPAAAEPSVAAVTLQPAVPLPPPSLTRLQRLVSPGSLTLAAPPSQTSSASSAAARARTQHDLLAVLSPGHDQQQQYTAGLINPWAAEYYAGGSGAYAVAGPAEHGFTVSAMLRASQTPPHAAGAAAGGAASFVSPASSVQSTPQRSTAPGSLAATPQRDAAALASPPASTAASPGLRRLTMQEWNASRAGPAAGGAAAPPGGVAAAVAAAAAAARQAALERSSARARALEENLRRHGIDISFASAAAPGQHRPPPTGAPPQP
jgi:serine/threonine protein kinase